MSVRPDHSRQHSETLQKQKQAKLRWVFNTVSDSPGLAMSCPGDPDPEPSSTLAHRVTWERFQPLWASFSVYKKGSPRALLTLLAKVVQPPGHGGQRHLLGRGRV